MGIANFKEAVDALTAALEVMSPNSNPLEWVQIQNDLGRALHGWGIHTLGAEAFRLLQDAAAVHRVGLSVCKRALVPEQWAALNFDLGIALSSLGERAPGRDGDGNLQEAVVAFRAAQEIYVPSGDNWPMWEEVQNYLNDALLALADRSVDQERRMAYLTEARDESRKLYLLTSERRQQEREKAQGKFSSLEE